MNAYFDLANLRSFAKAGGHQNFQICCNMLRHNFNIHFNFRKEDLDKEKKQSKMAIQTLLKEMTRNRGENDSISWGEVFPARPLSADIYSTMTKEQLTSIYFLDDNNIDEMVNQGCLLFASEGNELKVLSSLLFEGRDIPTKKYPVRDMRNWQVIKDNACPCTDIIIIDPYFFAQNEIFYEFNSYRIIELLSQYNTREIDVVIFTLKDNVIFKRIESQLKEIESLRNKLKLTFVVLPESGEWKEHDRTIITNYKMFDSDPSFTYFEGDGKNVSHGRWLNVNSLGDRDIRKMSLQCICDLQKMIDERKTGVNTIIGDKKSKLLKF